MTRGWRLALPLGVLVAIHLASLFGGFLAPNSPLEQNRHLSWAPPTKLRFVDDEGRLHLRPFIYPLKPDPVELDLYHEDRTKTYPLRFLVRGEPYHLAGLFPTSIHFLGVDPPGKLFLLGTDLYGRDTFARLLVGGRTSLFSGLFAASIALILGSLLGGAAGYLGGKADGLLMRLVELFMALPWLYLLLALRAFLPLALTTTQSFLALVALIGFLGWARPARLIRGVVLSLASRQHVTAAHGLGASSPRILLNHILPHATPTLLTQAALLVPSYVIAEVTLSFLGLGFAEPIPTWGNLLADLRNYHILSQHPHSLALAIPLISILLAYHALSSLKARSSHFAQRT